MNQRSQAQGKHKTANDRGETAAAAPARPKAPTPVKSVPSIRPHRRPAGGCEGETRKDIFTLTNRAVHALLGRLTSGVSPVSIIQAYGDWAWHPGISPRKQAWLAMKAGRKAARLWAFLPDAMGGDDCRLCIEPLPHDHRFDDEQWQRWPYNVIYQSFLLAQQWWHNATVDVDGVSPHHEDVVNFVSRQVLDVFAPSNSPFTNPKVAEQTMERGGWNFVDGAFNFLEDLRRWALGQLPGGVENYRPGETVALTPGKIIYRNRLIELIQYSPATDKVQAEPMLIILGS
jgi:polyhydroxyalkanoate synthase